jgi:hypothetical protein
LLAVEDISLRGILRFHREGSPEKSYDGHVYVAPYNNEAYHETEEMIPQLRNINKIPYHLMRDGDILWLPHILIGNYVDFSITFDKHNSLIDYTLQVEDHLFFDTQRE